MEEPTTKLVVSSMKCQLLPYIDCQKDIYDIRLYKLYKITYASDRH